MRFLDCGNIFLRFNKKKTSVQLFLGTLDGLITSFSVDLTFNTPNTFTQFNLNVPNREVIFLAPIEVDILLGAFAPKKIRTKSGK